MDIDLPGENRDVDLGDCALIKTPRDLFDLPQMNLEDADDPPTPEHTFPLPLMQSTVMAGQADYLEQSFNISPPLKSSFLTSPLGNSTNNSPPVDHFDDEEDGEDMDVGRDYGDYTDPMDHKDRYLRVASVSCDILDRAQLQACPSNGLNPFENFFASPQASLPRTKPTVAMSGPDSPLNFNSLRYCSDFDEVQAVHKSRVCTTFLIRRKFDRGYYFVKRSRLFRKDNKHNTTAGYDLFKEAQALSLLSHPNVVQYLSAWVESYEINLIMRYCAGGSVTDFHWPMGPRCGTLMACQLTCALAFLHRRGILHGDLYARNIVVDIEKPRNQYTANQLRECCHSLLHLDKEKCIRFILTDFGCATLMGNKYSDGLHKYMLSRREESHGRQDVNPILMFAAEEMALLGDICERTLSATKNVSKELKEFLKALTAMPNFVDREYYEKWIVNNPLLRQHANRPGCRSYDIFLETCEDISFEQWTEMKSDRCS